MMRTDPDRLADGFDLARLREVAEYPLRAWLFGTTYYAANDATSRFRPPSLPTRYLPDRQAWIARRGGRGRWIATLAGGNNQEAHNQNNLGHVNVWLDERPVFIDPGNMESVSDALADARYTYLSARSNGHNCLEFNDFEQVSAAGTDAAFLARDGGTADGHGRDQRRPRSLWREVGVGHRFHRFRGLTQIQKEIRPYVRESDSKTTRRQRRSPPLEICVNPL